MPRPAKPIDLDQLSVVMRFKPTQADVAAFFQCSEDTIARRIRDEYDLSFAEFRDQNMVHTRFSLIQKALTKATGGDNTMLIFCLKNMCNWSDRQEVQVNETKTVNIHATIDAYTEKLVEVLECKKALLK